MCLFAVCMLSALVLNVLATETLQFAATRNTIEYEQALYQANAGVHQACLNLMTDASWRGTMNSGVLPPATTPAGYSVTAVDNGSGGVTVLSTGYAGAGRRTLSANVEL